MTFRQLLRWLRTVWAHTSPDYLASAERRAVEEVRQDPDILDRPTL
jgi:hypothetical protein